MMMVVVVKMTMTIVMTMNNKMGRIVNAGETTQRKFREAKFCSTQNIRMPQLEKVFLPPGT